MTSVYQDRSTLGEKTEALGPEGVFSRLDQAPSDHSLDHSPTSALAHHSMPEPMMLLTQSIEKDLLTLGEYDRSSLFLHHGLSTIGISGSGMRQHFP
jgi:hypothetical protein